MTIDQLNKANDIVNRISEIEVDIDALNIMSEQIKQQKRLTLRCDMSTVYVPKALNEYILFEVMMTELESEKGELEKELASL